MKYVKPITNIIFKVCLQYRVTKESVDKKK